MMRKIIVISHRLIFATSITLNLAVISLFALWFAERIRANDVRSEQMHRIIRERSWDSAGKWRLLVHDADAMIIEYRLPYFDFHRYRLPAKEFRLSKEAGLKPIPFDLEYEGCEIMRYHHEKEEFECMPFRDLSAATP